MLSVTKFEALTGTERDTVVFSDRYQGMRISICNTRFKDKL